jgi:tetratricopeptide (TPR) repeat protein
VSRARAARAISFSLALCACAAALTANTTAAATAVAATPAAATKFPEPALRAALARAESLLARERGDDARALRGALEANVRRSGDHAALARVLERRGEAFAQARYAREGERLLREAIPLAAAARDTITLVRATRWLGVASEDQGRMSEADALFRRTFELGRRAGLEGEVAWALVGVGWHQHLGGRMDSALYFYRGALARFLKAKDRRGEAWTRNDLGLSLDNLGRPDSARAQFLRSAALAESLQHFNLRTWAWNNLGALELRFGDPAAAVRAFERAREYPDQHGRWFALAAPTFNLIRAYAMLGAFRDAETLADSTLTTLEREGYRELVGQLERARGDLEAMRERPASAARWYRRALAKGDTLRSDERGSLFSELAMLLAARDSVAAALALADQALQGPEASASKTLRVDLLVRRGELLARLGRLREAEPALQSATRAARELRVPELEVAAFLELARLERRLGRTERARAHLETARHAWESDRGLPTAPEWRERRGEAALGLAYEFVDIALGAGRVPAEAESISRAFDAAQHFKARTLFELATGPGGALASAPRFRPVTLATLQRDVLRPGELFLDYLVAPRGSFLFAISRAEARAIRLPGTAALGEAAQFFHDVLASPAREGEPAAGALGERLGSMLLSPAEPLIERSRTVLVSADGPLHRVPFAALRRTHDSAPLGETHAIAFVPSATLFGWLRSRAEQSPRALLVVAGGRDERGRALAGAEREARWLSGRYDGAERVHAGRGPALPPKSLARFGQLHFAVHTRVNDQYPWRCEISLGGAAVHASEIASLRLGARMAVLSSCESAGGRASSGEGVAGLASAFMAAGVPVVVASLWPVEDAATFDLMRAFYRALERGEPAAQALCSAQGAVRRIARTRDPFYWAGFVVLGDPALGAALKPRGGAPLALALVPVVLALVWVVGFRLGRSRRTP